MPRKFLIQFDDLPTMESQEVRRQYKRELSLSSSVWKLTWINGKYLFCPSARKKSKKRTIGEASECPSENVNDVQN